MKNGLVTELIKKDEDIHGIFTVILYGAKHANDLETIAILDMEGDGYEFEPFAPEFSYRIKKNLSAKEALDEAERFVSWHHSFRNIEISRILDKKGITIGYEVRPLYYPLDLGFLDVLDVDYRINVDKVIIKIWLIEPVRKRLFGDDSIKGIMGID